MPALPSSRPAPLDLLSLTRQEIAEVLERWGEPGFRSEQLWRWVYRDMVADFDAMSNLPLSLRTRLAEETSFRPLTLVDGLTSRDRLTRKGLFELNDGELVETVLMLYDQRRTVCVSTQVGCAFGCAICATGQSGLVRNLTVGEIVGQVLHYARWLALPQPEGAAAAADEQERRVSHVVLMGMGEPLANYEATWRALQTLNDARGLGLGARHMTVSTAGLVPGIAKMSQEKLQVGLAVSLHAPTDGLRSKLVPLNRRYPLADLMAACRHYTELSGRQVTFEYALLQGINDSDEQARALALLLRGLLSHVNLIPMNRVEGSPYLPSSRERTQGFLRVLRASGASATVRLRRGLDIEAGCGQLRSRRTTGRGQGAEI